MTSNLMKDNPLRLYRQFSRIFVANLKGFFRIFFGFLILSDVLKISFFRSFPTIFRDFPRFYLKDVADCRLRAKEFSINLSLEAYFIEGFELTQPTTQ